MLHIVLYQPQIPQNTGNIGRTCVAINAKLWLVEPLGFQLDAARVRRAGLDYWPDLQIERVKNFEQLEERLKPRRFWLLTKFAQQNHYEANFADEDVLVFGSETTGLPDSLHEAYQTNRLRIPIHGPVRSLNLATSVGIVAYEALRQTSIA